MENINTIVTIPTRGSSLLAPAQRRLSLVAGASVVIPSACAEWMSSKPIDAGTPAHLAVTTSFPGAHAWSPPI